ncbi:hypothetical protein EHW99_0689 [Erwinia amylovora]|uniref:Uncharacterized protein n=3 Tax=Erwinia amylovora TaxID=552 RepID=A0A831A0S1_ERWAM|nr:hypothetical protein EaACW_2939 [Erwinia amylovora ACW56400]QJQ53396.1 hypothetical protein EHX00_0689 [Erwinia amylovora]CBA22657.1 hypothetical protein predicted by Glimmer/Critica [Erwinia amylovora CFBP1430]CCO79781.1 hypothetical protein BN432_3002 [Erwinia amylovora Ea356]CCO83584.1 hypothetical protein BN433_3027 [Erwinia amylovora Ea266]CCO91141.1 hypothetical protein BN435_2989 [Erwinia amylovora 01SFR-BO]CCO94925.1 hypothetical protein BN437_3015 [Erwinia amylovora NBRC 12687 = C
MVLFTSQLACVSLAFFVVFLLSYMMNTPIS